MVEVVLQVEHGRAHVSSISTSPVNGPPSFEITQVGMRHSAKNLSTTCD
jgi:hypothetical protein